MKKILTSKTTKILSYIIFWSWNVIFLIFFFSVIVPDIGNGILSAIFASEIPIDFVIIFIAGSSVPFLSIILGLTKFKKDTKKLFQFFYGIEIPLGFVLFLRLAVLRELTPGTWQLLILLVFGGIVYLFDLLSSKDQTDKIINSIRFSGHTVLMLIAVYFGIIMLFYFIPIISTLFIEFFTFQWIQNIGFFFMSAIVIFFFLVISGTILLILPIAMPTLYIKKFIKGIQEFNTKHSVNFTYSIAAFVIILNIFLFILLNKQSQQDVFKMTDKDSFSLEEKEEILMNEEFIKKGLLNSYLASYRYIAAKDDRALAHLYEETFGINSNASDVIQRMYHGVILPFVYDGESHWIEKSKAEEIYAKLFDAHIQKKETKTIKRSLQATWDRDGVEAGLLNLNDEKVHIIEQSILIAEESGIAEIEICETYQNKTSQQQEILYHFSLPENAVITGLWLSDDSTQKKYGFNVSPRGAAQQVYKNEVQLRVDPSLLEQTGPNQYRLRAFPIPAVSEWERNSPGFAEDEFNDKLKLWLTYVCISKDGSYELPVLNEKRNVYWNGKTRLTINNESIIKDKGWLPEKLEASSVFNRKKVNLNDSISLSVSEFHIPENIEIKGDIAVYIDLTYSMRTKIPALKSVLEKLSELNNEIQIYTLTNGMIKSSTIENFSLNDIIFFGSSTLYNDLELLESSTELSNYNELIIITDEGSYELNKNVAESNPFNVLEEEKDEIRTSFNLGTVVNILHVNNSFPNNYDDSVLETIEKSKGFVSGDITDLLKKIGIKQSSNKPSILFDTYSGLKWEVVSGEELSVLKSNNLLRKIAAKQYIRLLINQFDSLPRERLDQIHKIAKEHGIVTQYSSMIVLVNDRQKEALKDAEQRDDRFEREAETGIESMTNSSLGFMDVSGTPEPEEWILIFITLLMVTLFYMKYLRK
jgi:putative PEP-CTERM system integral membrane protein